METSGSNTGKIVGSLLAGALAGAVLGVLFAPDKGSRTRKRISDGAEDLVNGLASKSDNITKKIKEDVDAFHNKAEELEDIAGKMIQDLKKSIGEKMN